MNSLIYCLATFASFPEAGFELRALETARQCSATELRRLFYYDLLAHGAASWRNSKDAKK